MLLYVKCISSQLPTNLIIRSLYTIPPPPPLPTCHLPMPRPSYPEPLNSSHTYPIILRTTIVITIYVLYLNPLHHIIFFTSSHFFRLRGLLTIASPHPLFRIPTPMPPSALSLLIPVSYFSRTPLQLHPQERIFSDICNLPHLLASIRPVSRDEKRCLRAPPDCLIILHCLNGTPNLY